MNSVKKQDTVVKKYHYKKYYYTITVQLNAKAERCTGGKQWDLVIVDCKNIYHNEKYVEREGLLAKISVFSMIVNSEIDNLENDKIGFEKILADMGFE